MVSVFHFVPEVSARKIPTKISSKCIRNCGGVRWKYTFFFYKNVEAQICMKFKNIVVILLVAISISFPASDEI